jgi:hypothetical protein
MLKPRAAVALAAPTNERLLLEEYFLGSTSAWGIFHDRFGNVRRQFKVAIDGTWDGRELILTEDFAYDDGSTDHRVWRIRKLDYATYQATANDVIGTVTGKIQGNQFRWAYDFRLAMGQRSVVMRFDDRMYLQDPHTLINRTRVTKFGIEVGQISMFFRKG